MVRIPVIKRDGRLEAERVVFDRPTSGSGTVGYPTVDAIRCHLAQQRNALSTPCPIALQLRPNVAIMSDSV